MKPAWVAGVTAAVLLVVMVALAAGGAVGLDSSEKIEPLPSGGGFMVTPAGEKVYYDYDADASCINASDDAGELLTSCGDETEGILGGATLRISVQDGDRFEASGCVRSRSFLLEDGRYGLWCIAA